MKKYLYLFAFTIFSISFFGQNVTNSKSEKIILNQKTSPSTNLLQINNRPAPVDPTGPIDPNGPIPIDPTPTGPVPSNEVGITEGALSVSLTGAANYNIPIAVPPGINGVIPQIGLSYSSQSGNGQAGYGWNISGVSMISRIPSTKFHDGTIDGVDFNSLDRFSFDGQRLLLKNPTDVYGANGTVYETEGFSNVKITSYGVHPSGANYGPAYFIVQYPDGSSAQYGISATSRSITDYAITYWENPQGIRISYFYTLTNNNLNIVSIKYGYQGTNVAINEVQFIYKARQRPEESFIGGQSIVSVNILSEIKVIGNGVGFRNYLLTHESTTLGYQRLQSITEKNGDKSLSYRPTVFSYESTTNTGLFNVQSEIALGYGNADNGNSTSVSGDFNGDGNLDLILYPNNKLSYYLYTYLQNGVGNPWIQNTESFKTILPTTLLVANINQSAGAQVHQGQSFTIIKTNNTTNVTSFNSFQANGILNGPNLNNSKIHEFERYQISYNPNEGCGQNPRNTNKPYPTVINIDQEIEKYYLDGDFNGDGITDIIAIEKNVDIGYAGCDTQHYMGRTGGITYFVNLDRRVVVDFVTYSGFMQGASTGKLIVADFNGDGKSDIFVINLGQVRVYTFDDNLQLVQLTLYNENGIKTDKPLLMGDYNADGKTDFAIPQLKNSDSWNFYMSTGVTFNATNTTIGQNYKENAYEWISNGVLLGSQDLVEYSFIPSDFNGDGKTDILMQQNFTVRCTGDVYHGWDYTQEGTPDATKLTLFENQYNVGSTILFNKADTYSQYTGARKNPISVFTNHNSMNQNLEYSLVSNNKITSFRTVKDSRVDVRLSSVITGNGVKETITYKPLKNYPCGTNCNSIYTDSRQMSVYPNFDIGSTPSYQVVSQLEKQSSNVYKKQQFAYYGAVSNVEGLGFLGFRATTRTNWFDANSQIVSSVSKNNIDLRGAKEESFSILDFFLPQNPTPNSGYISKSNTIYNVDQNGSFYDPLQINKVYKLQPTIAKQFNGMDGTNSETSSLFDTFGNPSQSSTKLKNGSLIEQNSLTNIIYDNLDVASDYHIGRPINKTNTVTIYPGLPDQDIISTNEIYNYQNNLLTQVKKNSNGSVYVTEDNLFDNFGNIIKKKTTIPTLGAVPRETNYEYDPSGRFMIKSYDIEGLVTNFNFNPNNGLLNSETNPFGLTTTYIYDSWFKKIQTTDFLGKSKFFEYSRNLEKTFISTSGDDGSLSVELFDDLGRKIRTGVLDLNSRISNVSTIYDIYDRAIKTSEPFYDNNPTQWSETKYDEYGRVYQSISFTGKTVTNTYSGLIGSTTDGIKSKSSTKNAIGNVISMTENPGGVINYKYFANGNLKSTNYEGVITTVQQDVWGRKVTLVDPSAGTYRYEYNLFGETTKEIVDNKSITIYDYDNFGKLNFKTIQGLMGDLTNSKVTYIYDASKLMASSIFNDFTAGTITNYTYGYDAFKRLIFTDESGSQAYFQRATQFDDFGRPLKELYLAINTSDSKGSSRWIRNTYQNGHKYQMIDDATNKVLYQINQVNERGQLLNANYGDAIGLETNTYDAYGFPASTSYKTINGVNTSSVPFLTLTNSFNPITGNLNTRTNSMFAWSENFTNSYDSLDRLLNYKDASGTIVNQTYDNRGRIGANNIGDYAYTDTNHPYQVTTVTPTNLGILAYYEARKQEIGYNAFKKPLWITVNGRENIDFEYNAMDSRAVMYYGGLQAKNLRPLRKFYSADGSMEIKRNSVTNTTEFVTYLNGDAYSTPVILKNNGNGINESFLYLHRDYQGSILAITNNTGQVVEKRLFDAWGSLIRYANNTGVTTVPDAMGVMLIDRGYTGHEHLLGVELINMNGRLYDPKFHRFLSPDNYVQSPYSTQSYNRYGYVTNNPFKYTDQSGEWFGLDDLVVAGASFIIGYVGSGLSTGNWGWSSVKSGLITAVTGWLLYNSAGASSGITAGSGSLNAPMWSFIASSAGSYIDTAIYNSISSYFGVRIPGIQVGNWTISVTPTIAFGNASGIGGNLTVTYSDGNFSFSGGIGIMGNSDYNSLGRNGMEIRHSLLASWDDGKSGVSLGTNIWGGDFAQRTGTLGLHFGNFRAQYENDGKPFNTIKTGDGGDSYRTAALSLNFAEVSVGFNLFTGLRNEASYDNEKSGTWDKVKGDVGTRKNGSYGERYINGLVDERGSKYRLGAAYIGYEGGRYGLNSEWIRHAIQNVAIHGTFLAKQRMFEMQNGNVYGYYQYRTSNIFSSW